MNGSARMAIAGNVHHPACAAMTPPVAATEDTGPTLETESGTKSQNVERLAQLALGRLWDLTAERCHIGRLRQTLPTNASWLQTKYRRYSPLVTGELDDALHDLAEEISGKRDPRSVPNFHRGRASRSSPPGRAQPMSRR